MLDGDDLSAAVRRAHVQIPCEVRGSRDGRNEISCPSIAGFAAASASASALAFALAAASASSFSRASCSTFSLRSFPSFSKPLQRLYDLQGSSRSVGSERSCFHMAGGGVFRSASSSA